MEIETGRLAADAYLEVVEKLMRFLSAEGLDSVSMCYGFGCDCPDEELYRPEVMPPGSVREFIDRAVVADYYRVGQDNMHISDIADGIKILLCHESYIHVETDDAGLCDRLKALWLSDKVPGVMEKHDSEWRPTGSE